MTDSAYCYIHSFLKLKKVPFWKNATFHFVATVVLAIVILAIQYFGGPTKDKQEQIITKVDENRALIEMMMAFDQKLHLELLQSYPLGYCLFAINRMNIILPYGSRLLAEYEIDWNSASIKIKTDKEITMSLPNITHKPRGTTARWLVFTFPRIVGYKERLFPILDMGRILHVDLYVELLFDGPYGIICVLGFKDL